MSCCETQFDRSVVDASLTRHRRRGPRPATRILVDAIQRFGLRQAIALDVGCGIGAVDHELLASNAISRVMWAGRTMTGVDSLRVYGMPHDQVKDVVRKYRAVP